ncbi:MAG: hypothetical protein C4524_03000 [Candidatus Zixiibacteriota bacterium]|nr:MAG: hypothetical protein C4524_03000 [candidate division Zixibacteria bacterium]
MSDLEDLLCRYFWEKRNGGESDCPDDATLLAFAHRGVSGTQAAGLGRHLETCAHCRFRLQGLEEIRTLNRETAAPDWLERAGDRLVAAALREAADTPVPVESLRLAADTSRRELREVSFGTPGGEMIVRCGETRRGRWRFALIASAAVPSNAPLLMEINNRRFQALLPHQPVELEDMPCDQEPVESLTLIQPLFDFGGNLEALPARLPAPCRLETRPLGNWVLTAGREPSRPLFAWLRSFEGTIFQPLPLESRLQVGLTLYLFDPALNRVPMDKLT